MQLALIDWLVIGGYAVFALAVGIRFARRAGKDVDQYFLSGRSLPWWIAGTSMVATTFASDTPLVIAGWVRTEGIWQNWLWWCTAASGMLTVFLFARYWRRGEVMTTAELSELRYGGREAKVLRGFLGVYQSVITNTIILCWVILAAIKIMGVLFEVDTYVAMGLACGLALTYSLLAGFWGVVVTDLVQFTMAMVGAVTLAVLAWNGVGGADAVLGLVADPGSGLDPDLLRFFPSPGEGGLFSAEFWTINFTTICVLLGVQWWAYEYVDGGMLAIQRISACKSERDGVLAYLWYAVAHFALRPWPWILVGLASLVVLPRIELTSPTEGVITEVSSQAVTIQPDVGDPVVVRLADHALEDEPSWFPSLTTVSAGTTEEPRLITEGETIAVTDPERAYVVMMKRYLPAGLLGLVITSLLAAFMSTVDTHVNLASSFFVNDLYRRFLRPEAPDSHYVLVARLASAGVLAVAGLLATVADSISDLFTFFMAFLSGVGPVYVARWLWWRVRARTEIVAILVSSVSATVLTFIDLDWSWLGSLSDGEGGLTAAGRLVLVVLASGSLSMLSLARSPAPDPASLTGFYRKVRPIGFWGPVRACCPEVQRPREAGPIFTGAIGGLGLVYGVLFSTGLWILQRRSEAMLWAVVGIVGGVAATWALRRLRASTDADG